MSGRELKEWQIYEALYGLPTNDSTEWNAARISAAIVNLFVNSEIPVARFKPVRKLEDEEDPEERMRAQLAALQAVSAPPELGPNGPVFRDPFAPENLPPEEELDFDEDD